MTPSETLIDFLSKKKQHILDIQYGPMNIWTIHLHLGNYLCKSSAEWLEAAIYNTLVNVTTTPPEPEHTRLHFLETKFHELTLSYKKMKTHYSHQIRLSYDWSNQKWVLMLVFGIPCLMVEHPKLDKTFEMFNDYLTCETTKLAGSSTTPKSQMLIQKFDSLDGELLEEISLTRFVDLYPRLSENHEPDFVERILNGETLYSISYHFKKK